MLARTFAAGSIVLAAACASIAGLEAPDPASTNAPASTDEKPSAVPDASSAPSPQDDGGGADAQPPPTPACPPPKKPDDSPCASPAECCSNACSEHAKCRAECLSNEGALCNPFGDDDCCFGLFCARGLPPRCKKCLGPGAEPEKDEDPRTCCSHKVDDEGKCE